MFVTDKMISDIIAQYGQPKLKSFDIKITEKDYQVIRSSQKNDRNHDVTLYIFKDDKIIVIAKPFYPSGLFRAPSGGLNPGEGLIEGAKREALEETGCEIEFEKFLLQTEVNFHTTNQSIKWRSFVFRAKYLSGNFEFTDKREIREVRLVKLEEFEQFSKIMRKSQIGGLHYRASLHDVIKDLL
ncbi:MAG: NUDIX hydrolase [candidate division Zixibacteria bacterium]|nr:NUDIX hydrolase [candidate division Zixibacteria bacterium]